jgi:hypothetical protein
MKIGKLELTASHVSASVFALIVSFILVSILGAALLEGIVPGYLPAVFSLTLGIVGFIIGKKFFNLGKKDVLGMAVGLVFSMWAIMALILIPGILMKPWAPLFIDFGMLVYEIIAGPLILGFGYLVVLYAIFYFFEPGSKTKKK